jgi:hypothetical protein
MKLAAAVLVLSTSFSAFSQSSCELRVQQLRDRLADAREQLRACEAGGGSNRGEVEQLRNENFRLREQNRRLQDRLDDLENPGPTSGEFLCAAGCKDLYGTIDVKYLMTGIGYKELEADMLAKQATQGTYQCTYGVKTYKCEPLSNRPAQSFCTAACKDLYGTPDQRYLVGVRGRNTTEAEVNALKEAQKKHGCTYGPKIIECR